MSERRVRRRSLLALTLVVLALHGWLLRGAPAHITAPQPPAPPAWVMHTAMIPATAPQRTAAPAPQVTGATLPSRKATSLPPAVVPVQLAQQAAEKQPQAARASSGASNAAPAPSAHESAPAAALRIPGPVRLHYQVTALSKQQTWRANGELHWRHDGGSYEARLEVKAPLLPTRTQRSEGRITPEGLAPLRFSDKGRSERAAHFERDKGKVSFSGNQPDAALLPAAQDRLSVMLQLGALIAGNPKKFPQGTSITIQTAGTGDAEPWQFTVEGEESLQLPGGTLDTLKLTRMPRKEFDQRVELWLAPGKDYVPVRLRLTQPNGDWVDQQWVSTDKG